MFSSSSNPPYYFTNTIVLIKVELTLEKHDVNRCQTLHDSTLIIRSLEHCNLCPESNTVGIVFCFPLATLNFDFLILGLTFSLYLQCSYQTETLGFPQRN